MSDGPQQKRSFSMGGGGNMKKRLIIATIGGLILLMLLVTATSLITSRGKSSTEILFTLAQQQTEIIRVADSGSIKARGITAQNLAITTKLAIASEQKELLAYTATQGRTIDPKQLGTTKNTKTDTDLLAAEQNNRYDETFTDIIQQELIKYQATIKQALATTSSQSGKILLTNAYNHAKLLINKPEGQATLGISSSV